mmetsp:Transcript_18285/g.22383  ORF Transcript_18285/g.22383 Transcript_18285/m.22383 type:complete len:443 (-) Transcript_18285:96-1424(-)
MTIHDMHTGRPMTPIPAYISSGEIDSISSIGRCSLPKVSSNFIEQLEKGVEGLKNKHGEDHLNVAVAIDAIGQACAKNEEYTNALRHFNDALELKKRILPQHHPSIADTLRSVGEVSHKIGSLQETEAAFRAALAIYRNAFEDRSWKDDDECKQETDYNLHHMLANTLVYIGSLIYVKNEFDLALKFYKEAETEAKMCAIDAVVLDRHSTDKSLVKEARIFISIIMNNIANVYSQIDERKQAINTYNNALNLQIQEVGEDHLTVSRTLHNMGVMHYHSGEYQLSTKCFKQVLKMTKLLLGTEHPSLADALINIAIVHEKAGEFGRAESALNAAQRVVTNIYDENDVRVGFIYNCLGALHARNDLEDDALECFSKALVIFKDAGMSIDDSLVVSTNKSIRFVENGNSLSEDSEESYDMMQSFLSCGGFCFNYNNIDKAATLAV